MDKIAPEKGKSMEEAYKDTYFGESLKVLKVL